MIFGPIEAASFSVKIYDCGVGRVIVRGRACGFGERRKSPVYPITRFTSFPGTTITFLIALVPICSFTFGSAITAASTAA